MSKPALSFIHVTDLHLESGERGPERFHRAVEEINALEPRPAFALVTGDFTIDGGMGEGARDLLGGLAMPVHTTAGNHDLVIGESDPMARYRELFGPERYSFDHSGVHVVVLDAHQPAPERPGWLSVVGHVEEEQLAWLRADLAAVPAGMPIIAVTHLPLATTILNRMDSPPEEAASWRITNGDEVLEILLEHGVRLVLQGHLHENEHLWVNDLEVVTTAAICASWWELRDFPVENFDGSPKGYRIVTVQDGEVTTRYQALSEAFQGPIRAEVVVNGSGDLLVSANVFDGSERWRVDCRAAGGTWQPMTCLPGQATSHARLCPHWWEALVPVQEVSAGASLVEVRTTAPDETETIEAISVTH